MKKLLWLVGLLAVFYGHSQWALSKSRALGWIEDHEQAVFAMKEGVCDDFAFDVNVNIRAGHPKGEWQVDGGKNYVCDYVRASNAHVRVLKPAIDTRTELVSLEHSDFPWMTAKVKVRQITTFTLPGLRTLNEVGETTYVLRRTIRSLQIAEMTSRSEGQFPR